MPVLGLVIGLLVGSAVAAAIDFFRQTAHRRQRNWGGRS